MAINYSTTVKNARMTVTRDAIDGGPAAGKLNIYSAAYATLLVSINLSDLCGTVGGIGVLTLSGMPKSGIGLPAAGAGTDAELAKLLDSDDIVVAEGLTIGVANQPLPGNHYNIEIDNKNIAWKQIVNLNSGTITHG